MKNKYVTIFFFSTLLTIIVFAFSSQANLKNTLRRKTEDVVQLRPTGPAKPQDLKEEALKKVNNGGMVKVGKKTRPVKQGPETKESVLETKNYDDALYHAIENLNIDAVTKALKEKLSAERAYVAIEHANAVKNKFFKSNDDLLKKAVEIQKLISIAQRFVYAVMRGFIPLQRTDVSISKDDLEFLIRVAEHKLAYWRAKPLPMSMRAGKYSLNVVPESTVVAKRMVKAYSELVQHLKKMR